MAAARLALIPSNAWALGNLAEVVKRGGRRPKRSMVAVHGLLDGSPRWEGAVSEAGGQVLPREFACGVEEERAAPQGSRRAARPRRDPLWDEARKRWDAEVHSPCGSTLKGVETPAGGQVLWAEVACGVGWEAVALQEARWA